MTKLANGDDHLPPWNDRISGQIVEEGQQESVEDEDSIVKG